MLYVISNTEDHELKSIKDYRKENICRWKRDNSSEIKLFGPVVRTLMSKTASVRFYRSSKKRVVKIGFLKVKKNNNKKRLGIIGSS